LPGLATGNYGGGGNDRLEGIINPWCLPDEVICVGAATEDGRLLYEDTARGPRSDSRLWPDLTAHGVDVVGPWPTNLIKPPFRRATDESNPVFRSRVPRESWDLYTIGSGTSFAAPQVARSAAQILYFLRETIASSKEPGAPHLFAITIPRDRFSFTSRSGERLTGEVLTSTGSEVEIRYGLDEPWKMVKQLLRDTAVPMPGLEPHEVGAGFVSVPYVEQQFGAFGVVDVSIAPFKVTEGGD
jgi:hypothetical protein